jgi:hypothetical protein
MPVLGCVPSKMIIRAANTLAEAKRVGKLAGHATVQPDWSIVARRIREEATDGWDHTVAVERFTGPFMKPWGPRRYPPNSPSATVRPAWNWPRRSPDPGPRSRSSRRMLPAEEPEAGFIKLIADAGILIRATSAGPAGGEVLGALAVEVRAQVPVAMLS